VAHLIVKQSTPSSTECDLCHPQVQIQNIAGEVAVVAENAIFKSLSGRKLQNFLSRDEQKPEGGKGACLSRGGNIRDQNLI